MEGLIRAGLAGYGLDPDKAKTLTEYGQLLLAQNRVMNLTAITHPAGVAQLHMLDCAGLLTCPGVLWAGRLIDVGAGAGFPGLVLKILAPELEVTLLDAQEKRVEWLKTVCRQLQLTGVDCRHGRAEEWAEEGREGYDLATARAVASLAVLAELCLPYVKVGGRFLAMKAVDCGEEVDRAAELVDRLGGRILEPYDYAIPGAGVVHRVVVVEKISPTPPGYPRRWAKIVKNRG